MFISTFKMIQDQQTILIDLMKIRPLTESDLRTVFNGIQDQIQYLEREIWESRVEKNIL